MHGPHPHFLELGNRLKKIKLISHHVPREIQLVLNKILVKKKKKTFSLSSVFASVEHQSISYDPLFKVELAL